jgi:ABC-type antimicrobial peptide transport system permease subunit
MEPSPWFEIVGVVRDLVPDPQVPLSLDNPAKPLVYHVLGSLQAQKYPLYLAMHVKGEPKSALPTVRRVTADLSPTLRLTDIHRLDEATGSDARSWTAIAGAILLLSALALLLSLAGIYSVTSFAVSRRTREIAVRIALGAPVWRVITTVFAKPIGQVLAGVTVGCMFVGALVALSLRDADVGVGTVLRHAGVLFAYGAAMMAVCAAACVGPVLRVFRVEPTDVLRDDQ